MTQTEFDWNGLSLASQVERIVCSEAERSMLRALTQIYRQLSQTDTDNCDYVDGHILMIVTKKQIAEKMGGCSARTVQRKMQAMSEGAMYCRFEALGPGKPNFFSIDVNRIINAPLEPGRRSKPIEPPVEAVSPLVEMQKKLAHKIDLQPIPRGETTSPGGETCLGSPQDMSRGNPRQKPETPETKCAPYHKTINHSQPNNLQTINTIDGSLQKFSFQYLQKRDFSEPAEIQKRFQEVVKAGIAKDCLVDRQCFFALMIHLDKQPKSKVRNPAGLLTKIMRGEVKRYGETWRTRTNDAERKAAVKMIDEFDYGPKDDCRSADLDEWEEIDESEYTDEWPLPEEVEIEPEPAQEESVLSAAMNEQLKETQERMKKEIRQWQQKQEVTVTD